MLERSKFNVPKRLMSKVKSGFSIERGTLTNAAIWMTTLTPSRLFLTSEASRMSPLTSSTLPELK